MALRILCVALLSAAAAGCNSTGCKCPQNGCDQCFSGFAYIPALSDVSNVTTGSPCTATYEADAGQILVMRPGAGACTVRVASKSGTSDVSQVRFTAVTTACGCFLATDASPLQPVDGGTQ
jgi:hypothetical protein